MLWRNLWRDLPRGDTLPRVLGNTALEGIVLEGRVLDLGAGRDFSSYFQHLTLQPGASVVSLDLDPARRPSLVANVGHGLPLRDASFDAVVCMNLLEHIANAQDVLGEVYRVLRAEGQLIGMTPFLYPVHPFPGRTFPDLYRYTDRALEAMLATAGFRAIEVMPLGSGPAAAALFLFELPYVTVIRRLPLLRFLLYLLAIAFDKIVYRRLMWWRYHTRDTNFILMYVFRGRKA